MSKLLWMAPLLMLLGACVAAPPEPPLETVSLRAIVRFVPTVDAGQAAYLDRLGRETETQVSLIRRLREQYVMHFQGTDSVEAMLQRLSLHPDIEFVQQDRLSHPQ